jgi:hypothetical protein
MSDDSDFFGNVFDDPEDDPLLGDDESSDASEENDSPDESSSLDDDLGAPSWMSDEPANGRDSDSSSQPSSSDASDEPTRKEIIVDQQADDPNGLDELNDAVGEGWRLVQISLAQPDGEQASSRQAAERFVAILEQDSPQSLFDFGAGG